jgi:phosphatidylserine/phosphatidylglycerophosphate/cardiolipin synthase-like enzyme
MRKILPIILTILISSPLLFSKHNMVADSSDIYMLPKESDKALEDIYKRIDSSKRDIKITIYTFTHKGIAKKLQKAAKRGVKIEIIFDKKQNIKDKRSMLPYLAKYKNITVYTLQGKKLKRKRYKKGIMHIKMALIDEKTVIFGSANWTYSAFSKNYELLYIARDYKLAKKFSKYFNELKSVAKLYD